MLGDPREAIEIDLETDVLAVTSTNGYDLPDEFQLITRQLLMFDQTGGLYPAVILQAEEMQPTFIELGWTIEGRLGWRALVYFKPIFGEVPATTANRYRRAIERAVMLNPGRSGYADWTELETTPLGLIWQDTPNGAVLEVTVRASIVYTYDPRELSLP